MQPSQVVGSVWWGGRCPEPVLGGLGVESAAGGLWWLESAVLGRQH